MRNEISPNPGGARASGQWIRRAVPLTISGQGVVAAQGLPAVQVGTTGELPAARRPGRDAPRGSARSGAACCAR